MFRSIRLFFFSSDKSRTQLQLENIYLRKQIEILKRSSSKPEIKKLDKIFFIMMNKLIGNWKNNLFIIKPNTDIK